MHSLVGLYQTVKGEEMCNIEGCTNAALWRDPACDANSPTSQEERSRLQSVTSQLDPPQPNTRQHLARNTRNTHQTPHIMSSNTAVTKVDLSQYNIKKIASGKVREIFEIDDQTLLFVATDRISAYDVILNNVSIPLILIHRSIGQWHARCSTRAIVRLPLINSDAKMHKTSSHANGHYEGPTES